MRIPIEIFYRDSGILHTLMRLFNNQKLLAKSLHIDILGNAK
jgi:hypothetical protein